MAVQYSTFLSLYICKLLQVEVSNQCKKQGNKKANLKYLFMTLAALHMWLACMWKLLTYGYCQLMSGDKDKGIGELVRLFVCRWPSSRRHRPVRHNWVTTPAPVEKCPGHSNQAAKCPEKLPPCGLPCRLRPLSQLVNPPCPSLMFCFNHFGGFIHASTIF